MAKKIDLVGKEYGRLTVTADLGRRQASREVMWLCECSCGNTTEVRGSCLRRGRTTSCGCFRRETQAEKMKVYRERRVYRSAPKEEKPVRRRWL